MMEKMKSNTKIKIISLLSALVLWMYVMAVVNPQDTKLYENIPITITNLNEIRDLDLIIDQSNSLVTSAYVKGTLSDLQKINKDNIDIYGVINNPIEGKNQLHLRATTSQQVSVDLKSDVIAINLEKKITTEKDLKVNIKGKYKDNVEKIELDKKRVSITGARSKVDAVKYVRADLMLDTMSDKPFTRELTLKALDSDYKEVEGVNLAFTKVNAKITLLQDKEVSIKAIFKDDNKNLEQELDYTISPQVILIKGNSNAIKKIDFINTEPIDISSFESNSKIVNLNLPDGITSDINKVNIVINRINDKTEKLLYLPSELFSKSKSTTDIEGNLEENIDGTDINDENSLKKLNLEGFDLPNEIKVTIKHNNSLSDISKDDIKLYIDLSRGYVKNKKYYIKYETDLNIKDIKIEPSYIKYKG